MLTLPFPICITRGHIRPHPQPSPTQHPLAALGGGLTPHPAPLPQGEGMWTPGPQAEIQIAWGYTIREGAKE